MIEQTLVIIPTFNEALNVDLIIETIMALYPGISILIVDDNSPDKTSFVVEALKTKHPHLHLIKRKEKLGLGTAYLEGFEWALLKKYRYIIQMDCDFSHDPKEIGHLLRELELHQADLVIGSRYSHRQIRTKGWPLHRSLLSLGASVFIRLFTELKINDPLGGFKCFRRETLEKIDLTQIQSAGYVFQFEMNYKIHCVGLKMIEVPITFTQRIMGQSKMNSAIIFEAVKIFIYLQLNKRNLKSHLSN